MPEPAISPVLRELIEAVQQPGDAFDSAVERLKAQLSEEVADEARTLYRQYSDTGMALALAGIAATVYLSLGNRLEHLRCRYDMLVLRFLQTDTLEGYLELKSQYFGLAANAEGVGATDVRFQALYSAADCLFFARDATADAKVRNALLLDALMVVTGVMRIASPAVAGPTHFDRFVSLLGAIVDAAMNAPWVGLDAAKAGALLKAIAPEVEARIPAGFHVADDTDRSVSIAQNLASLSSGYGSPTAGDQRLTAAAQSLGIANSNLELWLSLTRDRYGSARRSVTTPERLAEARRAIEREVDGRRKNFRSRAGRLWAAQAIDGALSGAVGAAIQDGTDSPSHLFEAVETLKARMLLDQMAGHETFPSAAVRADLTELERQVLRFSPDADQDEAIAESRLLSLLSVGLRWAPGDRREQLDVVEERYARDAAGFRDVAAVSSLSDVQRALRPDEALLEYFIPTHRTHPAKELVAIGITSSDIDLVPLPLEALPGMGMIGAMSIGGQQPVDVSPLGQAVWTTRRAITSGDERTADDWLRLLWRVLIFPMLNRWHYPDEFKRWIIIPHGPLHYLPFAALAERGVKGARLIQDVAITVSPSATVWLALRRRLRPPAASFLGIADPVLRDSGLPPLKDAQKELSNAIKSLAGFEITPLPADLATEDRVRQEIAGTSIVHFGAHGEFPESDPFDFHRILLAATKDHDGKLHAEELRTMDLSAARLVVLSICDGGLYRFGPGDEPLGLIPALFVAGAENVLAPLWKVEDRAARRLTSAFYRGLLKLGPAEALRRACCEAIRKRTPLQDWAGFVNAGPGAALVGPPDVGMAAARVGGQP